MTGKIVLALAAGFVVGWYMRSRQVTRTVSGGAAPSPALLSLIMQQPAVQ